MYDQIKKFAKKVDILSSFLTTGYRRYIQMRMAIHQTYLLKSWQNRPPAIDVIKIDPQCVEYKMPRWKGMFWDHHPGTIVGGEWDQGLPRFIESELYKGFHLHFKEGVPWDQTPYYDLLISELDKRELNWHGCETPSEILEQLYKYDELYQTINQEGYKSQCEIRSEGRDSRLKPADLCEVLVNIDRHGNPILDDGRHRFAIAHLLNLKSIPACVVVRHRKSIDNI